MKKGKFILKDGNNTVIDTEITIKNNKFIEFYYENDSYLIEYEEKYFYLSKKSNDNRIVIKYQNNIMSGIVYINNETIQFDLPIILNRYNVSDNVVELSYKIEGDDGIKKVIVSC